MRPDDVLVEISDDGVDLRRDERQSVGPDRERAVRPEHTSHLGMEAGMIEPVRRLRGRCEIDGAVLQRRLLRQVAEIRDARMALRTLELRDAAIGRDYAIVMTRQPDRCLTVAGRAIERHFAPRCQRCEIVEQFLRILGPVACIRAGVSGEMIFEGHGRYSRNPERKASIARRLSGSSSCGAWPRFGTVTATMPGTSRLMRSNVAADSRSECAPRSASAGMLRS